MTLTFAIPALPVRNIPAAATFYQEKLGFTLRHQDEAIAVLARDAVEIHLWEANSPDVRGAEPHLAGSASCRISTTDLPALYEEMTAAGIIHPNGKLQTQWWGVDDFSVLDLDGNLIAFFAPTPSPKPTTEP